MGDSSVASYAPAGGVLLAIGGIAAAATHDLVLIVLVGLLAALTFGVGVVCYRALRTERRGA